MQLLDNAQRRDWIRLSQSENVGPATFRQLIAKYGSAADALEALPELSTKGGLSRPLRIYAREAAEADLKWRDKQLLRLKDEVFDLEDGQEGITLAEFSLEDFRAAGSTPRPLWYHASGYNTLTSCP